ncbi:hypothetical protein FGO68_gene8925 [Halteria grandinella]|uniref:Uncharacterized protein n=1 Tax=Halteria grandinella TaxID=5974 RepID=A0A8J8P443_HALGN|nr:hypothetical protein FGO68_gene8925 [Halteria grandinella]
MLSLPKCSYPRGFTPFSSNSAFTVAIYTPAVPSLQMSSSLLVAHNLSSERMPSRKQSASKILDFPDPFRPVMADSEGSKSERRASSLQDFKPLRHKDFNLIQYYKVFNLNQCQQLLFILYI